MQVSNKEYAGYSWKAVAAATLVIGSFLSCNAVADETELLHRTYLVGETENVKQRRMDSPQPYRRGQSLRSQEIVEFASPPPPCGERVYEKYRTRVRLDLSVSVLGTCSSDANYVHCPTEYMPGYEKIYIRLLYRYSADREMELSVDVVQRGREGSTKLSGRLLDDLHKNAVEDIFSDLIDEAQCD